jgi:hypothetical protein
MDNQKAKFILHSWHGTGADVGDPQFTEALEQTERNPDLAAWLAHEQALDAAISRRLKEVPVPGELLGRILAGQEEVEPVRSRRGPILLALAAAVVLLATVAALWLRPAVSTVNMAAFEREMRANVSGRVRFTFSSANAAELQQWLEEQRGVSSFAIPASLKDKPGLGCRTWMWNDKPVGLICFLLDGKQAVHLFIVDRAAVPDAPVSDRPRFSEADGWTTAEWSDGGQLFLLMGRTTRETLEKLL